MAFGGWGRPRQGAVRPVGVVRCPLDDPLVEQPLLVVGELLVRVGRRHHHVGVGGMQAGDQFASLWIAGRDRPYAIAVSHRTLRGIEPQVGLAVAGIGAVAGKAVVGQDRENVAVKPERFCARGSPAHAVRRHPAGDREQNAPCKVGETAAAQAVFHSECSPRFMLE